MISCLFFNAVLDHALNEDETLEQFIAEGKLISFADDILGLADSKEEATKFIQSLSHLEKYGLIVNKLKIGSSVTNKH